MENRLIYFAAPAAEKQEAGVDAPKNEKSDGLEDAAANRARLEGLKAKPGGTEKTRQGRALIEGGKCSATTEDLLKKQISAVEAAVATRKNKLTPETTEALNKANEKLRVTVEKQKSREAGNATADAKMQRMTGLGRADEIFKDVKISVNGKEFKWKKGEMANFKDLPLEGKKAFLEKMEAALLGSPDGTEKILAEFKKNKKLPDKWTKDGGYCDNPEKDGQTKAEAAKWLLANADQKILQAETAFKFLEGKQDLLAKAGEGMPTKNDIFEKSTSEFNQYFEGLKRKIETVDADQAAGFEKMKLSEGAKIETVGAENTAAIEKEKAEKDEMAKDLAPKLREFAKVTKFEELVSKRQKEIEASGKKESATEETVANLRERAQAGEKISVGEKLKSFLGFQKKATTEAYSDSSSQAEEVTELDQSKTAEQQKPENITLEKQTEETAQPAPIAEQPRNEVEPPEPTSQEKLEPAKQAPVYQEIHNKTENVPSQTTEVQPQKTETAQVEQEPSAKPAVQESPIEEVRIEEAPTAQATAAAEVNLPQEEKDESLQINEDTLTKPAAQEIPNEKPEHPTESSSDPKVETQPQKTEAVRAEQKAPEASSQQETKNIPTKEVSPESVTQKKEQDLAEKIRQQLASSSPEQSKNQQLKPTTQQEMAPKPKAETQPEKVKAKFETQPDTTPKTERPRKVETEKESPAARARREVAQESLTKPEGMKTFTKNLGLKEQIQTEDSTQLQGLLTLKNFDPETIGTKLTPEMMRALKRNEMTDEQKLKKAA